MEQVELIKSKWNQYIYWLLLGSVFLFPVISINPSLPTIHLSDILLLAALPTIFLNLKRLRWQNYFSVILIFIAVIIISIIVNNRIEILRDYFEILKQIKYLIAIAFSMLLFKQARFNQAIDFFFILLVIANVVQYFGLFGIEDLLIKVYGFKNEVMFFGKNTLGEPDTKRIIGLIGNPNNNAILFLFFTIHYFNNKIEFKSNWKFYTAILFLFLCQSKISLLAFGVVYLVGIKMYPVPIKDQLKKAFIVLMIMVFVLIIDGGYIINGFIDLIEIIFFNKTPEPKQKSMSIMGRWEVWVHLFDMIKDKPIIGHAPFKDYFYERNLYSENEYILNAWRYGIIGLLFYITLLIMPIQKAIKKIDLKESKTILLFSLVIMICALTNNPLHDRSIFILYAILLGGFFQASERLNSKRS